MTGSIGMANDQTRLNEHHTLDRDEIEAAFLKALNGILALQAKVRTGQIADADLALVEQKLWSLSMYAESARIFVQDTLTSHQLDAVLMASKREAA